MVGCFISLTNQPVKNECCQTKLLSHILHSEKESVEDGLQKDVEHHEPGGEGEGAGGEGEEVEGREGAQRTGEIVKTTQRGFWWKWRYD